MTESSYLWEGHTVGDAVTNAPYMAYWDYYVKTLLQLNPAADGVIANSDNNLQCVVSGTNITVDTGAAMVYGSYYTNDALLTLSTAGDGYYYVILRKDWTAQTIRAVILGPNAGTYPTLTQVAGTTWEIALASFVKGGGVVGNFLWRPKYLRADFERPLMRWGLDSVDGGIGASDIYGVPNKPYPITFPRRMQIGASRWTGAAATNGSKSITFPVGFTYAPVIIATARDLAAKHIGLSAVCNSPFTSMTIYWRVYEGSTATAVDIFWMAIGIIERGY